MQRLGQPDRALALAGCATLGNPPAADNDTPLYTTSQSNLTSLSEVIEKHPDDPQAYNMRGSVYGEAGRNDQALADFNKAISLDPNYAQAYANRALIYRKTGKLDLALADDNKALAIDANYAPAYLGRGIVYREQGRSSQALGDFNKAIALRAGQCGGLLQSRPALSEPAPAPVRHRRFLDRASGLPTRRPSPMSRARSVIWRSATTNRRRTISTRRCSSIRWICGPGPAAALPMSGWATRTRLPAPMPRRSISTTNTSRP